MVVKRRRRAMTSLEAVMSTAVMFPLAVILFYLGIRGCVLVYRMIAVLVGQPTL